MTTRALGSARVDASGRLLAADDYMRSLQECAGGSVGDPLLVPQLASLARQASLLAMPMHRVVRVADGDQDVELTAGFAPEGSEIAITLTDRIVYPPRGPRIDENWERTSQPDISLPLPGFHWAVNGRLNLTALEFTGAGGSEELMALLGQPLSRFVRMIEDDAGELPLLQALVDGRDQIEQPAVLRALPGAEYILSATVTRDPGGRILSFQGIGRPRGAPPPASQRDDSMEWLGMHIRMLLRDPLVRIAERADALASKSAGPLRHAYVAYAIDIANAARHLLGLVDDLAEVHSLERPDFRPETELIDLADIAARAAGLLQVRATDRNVRIDRPESDVQIHARGDFRRTLQILVNLIGNAVRYSGEGGQVRIKVAKELSVASVSITDDGPGIAPEDHERIFGKFERLATNVEGGSGLGLFISRRLARAMGGEIRVDSRLGEGARFTLFIPIADDPD